MVGSTLYCDVLVIGGGAAGLTAAAVSASCGLDAMLVEQERTLGGTTSTSGGTVWIPNNPMAKACGIRDSQLSATAYIDYAFEQSSDYGKHHDTAVRDSYLSNGPAMVQFLRQRGFRWRSDPSQFPDYHPHFPGALVGGGRTLDPATFDAASLGSWKKYLELPKTSILVSRFEDFRTLTRPLASPWTFLKYCGLRLKSASLGLFYGLPTTMGMSLTAQLLDICRHQDVKICNSTRLIELITDRGKVVGGILETQGRRFEARSRRGVFLAAAGFARNQDMRNQYLPKPSDSSWSLCRPGGDTGHVIATAASVGAATSLLRETWGIPTMKDPGTGNITNAMFEIAKPHSIVVSRQGQRFANECLPYGDFVHAMYEAREESIPAWLILDQQYLRKYTLGSISPWSGSESAVKSGHLVRADTITLLSQQLGMPCGELEMTVQRWNTMCAVGVDCDYGRGADSYQRFIGDQAATGNPTMGSINAGPFFAVQIFPGDAGTKGGSTTNSRGEVLKEDGSAIEGLYAAGNVTASLFGPTSLGAGVTIGPAMTFAFVAVRSMAGMPVY